MLGAEVIIYTSGGSKGLWQAGHEHSALRKRAKVRVRALAFPHPKHEFAILRYRMFLDCSSLCRCQRLLHLVSSWEKSARPRRAFASSLLVSNLMDARALRPASTALLR